MFEQVQGSSSPTVGGDVSGSTLVDTTDVVSAIPDPFDPAALRLSQDFGAMTAVKKVLTVVPVRKPNRQEWFRVRPGEDWRLQTGIFEDKINRATFLVARDVWSELADEIVPVCIYTAITRQNDLMLWPCKLPSSDGRSNPWNESALATAKRAETAWVRMLANFTVGMYDAYEARGELGEPTWPDIAFRDLIKLAFKGKFIDNADHPLLRSLRGE